MMPLRQITLILLKSTNNEKKIIIKWNVYILVRLCYVYFMSDCRIELMITYDAFCVGYGCSSGLFGNSWKMFSKTLCLSPISLSKGIFQKNSNKMGFVADL